MGQDVRMAQMIQLQEAHDGELKVYKRQEADKTVSDFWYYSIIIPSPKMPPSIFISDLQTDLY